MPDAWLAAVWPVLMPQIERACARSFNCYTSDWIAEQLSERQFQLWAATGADGLPRAVIVTHLNRYPTGLLAAQIILLAGHDIWFAEQAQMIDTLKAWARGQGAQRLEYAGRKGFLRSCPGWRQTTINAVLDLSDG